MTARTPTYLKGRFETNDIPSQTDYQDVFDSYINTVVSSEQSIDSNLRTSKELSAESVSANTVVTSSLRITTTTSANTLWMNLKLVNSTDITASAGAGTQAGATRLIRDVNYVFGNAILGYGVVLATAEPGRMQVIINTDTTALSVF